MQRAGACQRACEITLIAAGGRIFIICRPLRHNACSFLRAAPADRPCCPERGRQAAQSGTLSWRASMKQASSRELFGYWAARRGQRAAPERGEIEPSAIRRALGDVFILEFDRTLGHPFRLAGTRLCALFGRELKNERFLEIWEPGARAALADLLDVIADEATGVVASANGRTSEGWAQDVEIVLLPLAHRGDTHARMI